MGFGWIETWLVTINTDGKTVQLMRRGRKVVTAEDVNNCAKELPPARDGG
jgi:urease gamma subunit